MNKQLSREQAEGLITLMKEKIRRDNFSLNTYKPDSTPDRNQLDFHKSQSRYRVAFGGNQSGKSVVSAYEVASWATNKHRWLNIKGPKEIYVIAPEYRILYIGVYRHLKPDGDDKSMKFLDRSMIKSFGPRIPGAPVPIPSYMEVYCDYNSKGILYSKDNEDTPRPFSTIWFISADGGEEARKKIQAAAIDLAVVDEEVDETIWDELQMRFLAKDGKCCISCTLVRSEEWLLKLEDRAERGDTRVFMTRLNTETSQHLSSDAKNEILSDLSEETKDVRVYGRSRRQHGLIYSNFSNEHVYNPNDIFPNGIPNTFRRVSCNDPGFRVHAGLWCAIDDANKTLYFYREMYSRDRTLYETCCSMADVEGYRLEPSGSIIGEGNTQQYFKRIPKNAFGDAPPPEQIDERLIDPAQVRNMEDGRISIAGQMIAYYDTIVMPANNDVQSGIEAVRLLLRVNPLTKLPHIQVSSELEHFFSERRRYRMRTDTSSRNNHTSRAEPLRKHNHLMDTWRYICIHVLSTYGEYYKVTDHTFGRALDIPASISMSERLEEQAERIRSSSWKAVHPYLGSQA